MNSTHIRWSSLDLVDIGQCGIQLALFVCVTFSPNVIIVIPSSKRLMCIVFTTVWRHFALCLVLFFFSFSEKVFLKCFKISACIFQVNISPLGLVTRTFWMGRGQTSAATCQWTCSEEAVDWSSWSSQRTRWRSMPPLAARKCPRKTSAWHSDQVHERLCLCLSVTFFLHQVNCVSVFLGSEASFIVSVKQLEQYPVDLYYLVDVSASMQENLDHVGVDTFCCHSLPSSESWI